MPQKRAIRNVIPIAMAIILVLMLGWLALALGPLSLPTVLIDPAQSAGLSPNSGVVRLADALLSAFRPGSGRPAGTGDDPRVKDALQAQVQYLQRASQSAVDGNSTAFESQLEDIRRELDAEVMRQMKSYRESLDAGAENEMRRAKAQRAEELQRFRRSLEAQYAGTILNLKLKYQAAGLAEKQGLDRELTIIQDEIERQVSEREASDQQGLAELQDRLDRQAAEKTRSKLSELMDWADQEYRRVEAAQLRSLTQQNADLVQAILQGVRTRTGEMKAGTGGR